MVSCRAPMTSVGTSIEAQLGGPLAVLPKWQVYRLTGAASALPVPPFSVGLLVLAVVGFRVGQGGSRLPGSASGHGPAAGTDRDDDRFWKGRADLRQPRRPRRPGRQALRHRLDLQPREPDRGWSSLPSWPPPPAYSRSALPRAWKIASSGSRPGLLRINIGSTDRGPGRYRQVRRIGAYERRVRDFRLLVEFRLSGRRKSICGNAEAAQRIIAESRRGGSLPWRSWRSTVDSTEASLAAVSRI
jgi:hypothetical protein